MTRHLAIVIESLGGGGAQHVATSLANAWATEGADITVITLQDAANDAFTLDPRIRRIVIGGSGRSSSSLSALLANFRRVRSLRAAIRASRADVILSFVAATNVLSVLARFGLPQRLVISERNDPALQSLGPIWNAMRRRFYRYADLAVANSHAAIETMSAYVPRDRLIWLPNPVRQNPPSYKWS